VAKATIDLFHPKTVCVAMDKRESSPSLCKYIESAYLSSGVQVLSLGITSTPEFYFATANTHASMGLMVTASHNPSNQNGLKISGEKGIPINESQLEEIKRYIENHVNDNIVVHTTNKAEALNISNTYIKEIVQKIGSINPIIKIVVDFNGSSIKNSATEVFKALNLPVVEVKNENNGNPLEERTREALKKAIKETGADVGIIYDSDGDRAVFVDENGGLIPLSFVLGMLGVQALEFSPAKKVAIDVRAGLVAKELVETGGGEIVVVPAWHQFIQYEMQSDRNICFGGETSGHFMYADFDFIDDGLLASLRFLKLVSKPEFKFQLASLKRKYFELPETNFKLIGNPALVLDEIANYYRSRDFSVHVVDGVTVYNFDWKLNIRASATEPLLRLNIEAKSSNDARKIKEEIESLIEKYN
jgi:phosphomannomutase